MPLERRPRPGENKDRIRNPSRMSPDPGYAGVLPRVFPYVWKGSREDASSIIVELLEVGRTGFALTEHTRDPYGSVSLWMSAQVVAYLLDIHYLRRESIRES